jgi:predicted AlkP superfamily phosphohydrolase/phosphomutase
MSSSRARTVLIGLDAAAGDLLFEGCDRGLYPNLAALRDRGAWGIAEGMPGFGSGAIWPSFSTGVNPAKHGRYFYRQVGSASYGAARFEATDFKAASLWEVMSAAGRRVAVFDVPKAGLSEDLNGIQAVDWIVHGPVYKRLVTWPAELAEELAKEFGSDPLPSCDRPGGRNAAEHAVLRDLLVARVRQKEACAVHYLGREPWDLFITVFAEPHCVGHQCWHVRDPAHPMHDAEAKALVGDPVLDVYAAIDTAIGRIAAAAGPNADVIVFSGTGMAANYGGNHLLDEILRRLEGREALRRLDWLTRAKRALKSRLPSVVRRRLNSTVRRIEDAAARGDRERRKCFAVPHNDIAGAVRVNLAGRDPNGHVEPGADYDAFFTQLRRDLLDVRNLDTGNPIATDVVRIDEICSGAHLDELPDFFVLWNREAPIERVSSPKIGTIEFAHRGNRTGDHRPDSVFVAAGPHVIPGETEPVSILDFAPTLAALHDVTLPDADGQLIRALIRSGDRDRAA